MKKMIVTTAAAATALLAQPDPRPEPAIGLGTSISAQVNAAVSEAVKARTEAAIARSFARKNMDDDHYRRASRLVDDRKYEEALKYYQQIIEAKGSRIEGSLYWKAYVLGKLSRRDEALASLEELKKGYAQSRWLNDARALELEIKGGGTSPEAEGDEELKLLAINGLLSTDPERAVPLLEKQLNNPKNSPKLKERALFVLAQSKNARAREIVGNYANGASNPDLQLTAVQYLGTFGGKENRDKLMEIYRTGSDLALKRAVLRGLMISRDHEALLKIARSEQNADLQRDAIRYIGSAGGDVAPLWTSAASKETKDAVLEGLRFRKDTLKLSEIAKSDPDAKIRRQAIGYLADYGSEGTSRILVGIYSGEQDKQVRSAILRGLFQQSNAKALIELARKESDPGLKRESVQFLSHMKSPEATEFLVELLNK